MPRRENLVVISYGPLRSPIDLERDISDFVRFNFSRKLEIITLFAIKSAVTILRRISEQSVFQPPVNTHAAYLGAKA